MKKLRLDLDQIQVVSFTPRGEEQGGGTVNAAEADSHGLSCLSCFPVYCPREPDTWTCGC
jgi:hypothetical protein